MIKDLIMFAALSALCACAIPQPDGTTLFGGMSPKKRAIAAPQPATTQYVDEVVNVVTDPPGARIQINDAFAGYSPLKYPVRRYWRGQMPDTLVLDMVKVEALPVFSGQCVQSGMYGENNKVLPSPVSFRMADCRDAYEHGYNSVTSPAEVKPQSK